MSAAPAAALVCAMLTTFAAPAAATVPTRLVATGFVAVTTGTGSMQIFSFDLQGGHEKRLTQGTADRHYPSLAPDGTRLLYTGEDGGLAEVYLLDLVDPSATPRAITKAPLTANSASWSPDGATILYSALPPRQKAYQVFKSRPDGSGVVQLTHTSNAGNASPVFSPDGSRIAYINGSPAGTKTGGLVDRIWLMDADGTNARPLTAGPRDAYPAWLDANTILFARSFGADRGTQVFGVGLDGAERALSPAGQLLVEPKPLPDGRGYGATQSTRSGLRLVKVERSDHAALTTVSPAAGFDVTPIEVPPHDGSVFTLDWILANAPAAQGGGSGIPAWLAATILGAVALAIAVLVGLRRFSRNLRFANLALADRPLVRQLRGRASPQRIEVWRTVGERALEHSSDHAVDLEPQLGRSLRVGLLELDRSALDDAVPHQDALQRQLPIAQQPDLLHQPDADPGQLVDAGVT